MEKKKSHLVAYGIVSVVLAIVIIIAIALYRADIPYKLTPQEALEQLKNNDNFIDPIAGINKDAPKTIFIDVRSPHDYSFNHFKDAINIPAEKILQDDYLENIRDIEAEGNTIVLYGNVPHQAAGPWMLLKQIGVNNIKMYAGTFEQLMSNEKVVVNTFNEVPVIDTAALKKNTVASPEKSATSKAPAPKKEVVPLKVQPAPERGGGC